MKNRFLFLFLIFCCVQLYWGGEVWAQCESCDFIFNSTSGDPDVGGTVPWNSNGKTFCITATNRTGSVALRNATNATICISENTVFTGGFQNLSNPTILNNYGQIGTIGTPINFALGTGSHFYNEGFLYGNFTSNGGAKITNRNTIVGNITLNNNTPTPSYINSGSQTGNLNLYSGSVTNSGVLNLTNFNFSNSTTFTNTGNTIVNNNVEVNGVLNNSGNFSVNGYISVNSNSTVTNSGNLSSTGNFTSNSTVNSSSGNIYVGGKLTVNGGSVFKSGNTNIDGDLENNGQISISGQLSVNGNSVNNGSGVISGGPTESCNGFLTQGPTFTNWGTVGSGSYQLNVSKNATNQYAPIFGSNAQIGECGCTPRTAFSSEFEVILVFNCPGNYTWSPPEGLTQYEVLTVGGGGSGGNTNNGNVNKAGGGGGAGAVKYQKFTISAPGIVAGQTYSITVGDGGKSNGATNSDRNGQNSTFTNGITTITAGGGGSGGRSNSPQGRNGNNGSSGGGAGAQSSNNEDNGGNGITSGGNSKSSGNSANQYGGGGGGNSFSGTEGSSNGRGGDGGQGTIVTIGFSTSYGGGGGGGAGSTSNIGLPGLGGGGNGGNENTLPGNGLPNSGAGGGGAGGNNKLGGNGGSGIVIIRYENYKILPVDYLYFNATYLKEDNSGILDWSTAKEWENSHFEIERAVNSVKEWETIGRVEGKGYSENPEAYTFTDNNLPITGGNIFYRLKQVDFSGKYSYSRTRAIQAEATQSNSTWTAFPNPSLTGSDVSVQLTQLQNYHDQSIYIRLVNMLGDGESMTLTSPEEVSQVVSEWIRNKNAGIYILDIRWGTNSQQIKLLRN